MKKVPSLKRDLDARAQSEFYRLSGSLTYYTLFYFISRLLQKEKIKTVSHKLMRTLLPERVMDHFSCE